jgi:Mrp family chromosome partitioning ATPase/capsular polysaccharide biosynthesis protein
VEQTPRYATLHDYLRVIRRRWLIVVGFTLGFAAAALALSLAQKPTYEAEAQLSFRDIAADINIVAGTPSSPDITASTRAATNAQLITRPEVTRTVERKLDTGLSEAELAAAVDTRVGLQTNLVILTAREGNAALAADIANAYADAVRKVGSREAQELLADLEQSAVDDLREADTGEGQDSFRLSALQDRLSRVRTLREVTEPVEVVVPASRPTSPVSPKPARNTVLGLLMGLVLGLLAAFIRDSLDRRLHGPQDTHHELDLPILGRVSEDALVFPGLANNGRPPMSESHFEAFRTLRTNLRALTDDDVPRSILVTSGLPDEGKTAVSLSLASAFAVAGQRVLLVECDFRRPSFHQRMGVRQAPGLTDYLSGSANPHDVLQVVDLSEPGPGTKTSNLRGRPAPRLAGRMVCISAGSAVALPAELLGGARFSGFLEKVMKAYDVVVIDASPLLSVVDPLELVPLVDCVLLCVRSGQTTRDEARAAQAALAHLPERPTGAVLTGLKRDGVDGHGYYYGY